MYATDHPLHDMTWDKWQAMRPAERDKLRDLSGLTPQLLAFEGCRVEVVTTYDEKRRFNVGRSTGWRPCHIELLTQRSTGGTSAEKEYKSVKFIRRFR